MFKEQAQGSYTAWQECQPKLDKDESDLYYDIKYIKAITKLRNSTTQQRVCAVFILAKGGGECEQASLET
jgi:hypothetical protein